MREVGKIFLDFVLLAGTTSSRGASCRRGRSERAAAGVAARGLVVRAGEAIVCPSCGEVLLVFAEDVCGMEAFRQAMRAAMSPTTSGLSKVARCRHCGEQWGKAGSHTGRTRRLSQSPAPQIHLHSGTWTGWRAIGGE